MRPKKNKKNKKNAKQGRRPNPAKATNPGKRAPFGGRPKGLRGRIAPTRENMGRMLAEKGVPLSPQQLDQLWAYHQLIRKHNHERELTRIIGFENSVVKHYLDCLVVGDYVHLPSPLLDIGTGAGFPGIVLKIRYPQLKVILAEPRPKRTRFLNLVIQELGLKDIEVFDHKVVSRSFTKPVAGVITRALETMDKTFLRTSACLSEGGLLVFMKGPGVEPEIADIEKRFGDSFSLLAHHSFQLKGTPFERRLIVYEKKVPVLTMPEQIEGSRD